MKKILLLLLLPIITFAQKEVVIHIQTDSYPSETKWTLYKDAYQGDTLGYIPYGYYTQGNTMHSDTIYIPDSITNISFVIFDSYGDGIVNGSYYVTICNDTIVSYPVSTFQSGLIHNRTVPQCMPNPPPGVPAKVVVNLDQYQGETSWDIKDTNGITYAYGGNYSTQPDYATVIEHVNIPKGSLTFTIYDTYGDGLNGALWQGQNGSYYLIQCNDTLVYGTDPAFGNDTTHVFLSDSCPPILGCIDINYVEYNHFATVDDGSCQTLKIYGCVDSTMYNYDSLANTMDMIDSCGYTLILHDLMGNGWVGSKLTIYADDTTDYFHTGGFSKTYNIGLRAPRPITAKFFITSQASLTTIECGFTLINPEGDTTISIQPPFIQPLFSYNMITNCGNTCIEKVFGCLDTSAVNYNSLANTSDSSCYYTPGCTNSSYLEYYTQGFIADHDDGSCLTLAVWGCMDSSAFNYNPLANIDNGGCMPIIMGCMESLAFNYNSLANTPDTCIAYLYGCTDPTMFNYDPMVNTDNGTCIPYVYGCTDSTAFNYDLDANTDNGSCVQIIHGCMDQNAWNYDILANAHDSISCLYNANCITGPGNPYWLNDPCYSWVIDVDEYCCENEWDEICQLTYDHCEGNWVGPLPKRMANLIMITDVLGRPAEITKNQLLFFIYDDGTVEKKIVK